MPRALLPLSTAFAELIRRASARNDRLIARAQLHDNLSAIVQDGRLESLSSTSFGGVGLQVFLDNGGSALGAVDRLDPEDLPALLEHTSTTARAMEGQGLDPVPPASKVAPLRAELAPPGGARFEDIYPGDFERVLRELGQEAARSVPDLAVRVAASITRDAWRIARWDGSDVSFVVPRSQLLVSVTARGNDGAVTQRDNLSSGRLDLHTAPNTRKTLLAATSRAARAARALIGAPPPPSGSCPLIIDHALAKGLAHEALGHAAEADALRASILATNERYRRGERVASERVSIVDEAIIGDHAFQPVSAHGIMRRKTVIVRDGRLDEALTDLFSAERAGLPLRGASRAQDYACPPIPRMSNIRIELREPRPIPAPWREIDAQTLRDLAGDAGLFDRHREIVFLSGYTGGQVNPKTGSFVFNSLLSYRLRPGTVELCQPAVFSGSALAALRAIREGFGPLTLDAIGQCGKAGQHVPSSGGSHAFVFLEADEQVLVGGRSGP